jgi:predicted ATP-grasp superfamily ATP-dependent carboligase
MKKYDVLVPVGYITSSEISKQKGTFTSLVNVPVADYEYLRIAADKSAGLKLAEKLGVPIPKTYYPETLMDVRETAKTLNYPVVVKGSLETGKVRYASSPVQLENRCIELSQSSPDRKLPLIQEYIPGRGYGFFALFNKGKPKCFFMHKRILEYPPTGGPSVVAESVYEPKLKEYGIKLMSALNWNGVAMAEFKLDLRNGKFVFIEMNPKFWGSLDLAIASGVDFPYLLCKMAVDGDVDLVSDYKVGVRFVWPFPDALLHFLSRPGSSKILLNYFLHGAHNICIDDLKPNLIQAFETGFLIAFLLSSRKLRYPHGRPSKGI